MDHREVLAPAVAHWQQVQQMEAELGTTKLQLLTDQQEHSSKLIRLQQHQVGRLSVFGAPLSGVCVLHAACMRLARVMLQVLGCPTASSPYCRGTGTVDYGKVMYLAGCLV